MSKFEVGISTRDRWQNLERAIKSASRVLPEGTLYRVAVDGGEVPKEVKLALSCFKIDWREDAVRKGYIVRRNELIHACEAPFYLSLDDDSYPLETGLDRALRFLGENQDVGVIGFPIRRPDGSWQVKSKCNEPYQTRSYVGCAHLLRVEPFKRHGGYDVSLIHQGEESQWGAQLLRNGLKCMHYPGLTFLHEATNVARSNERIRYHAARNKILWLTDFSPSTVQLLWRLLRSLIDQGIWSIREFSFARISGLFSGFKAGFFSNRPRHPLSGKQFASLLKLPYY